MIYTLAVKEIRLMFLSMQAWVLMAFFLLILTWFFLSRLDAYLELQPQLLQVAHLPGVTEIIITPVFAIAAVVFLMLTPILTMRLVAEERRNHTLVLLKSSPISMAEIVLGKYLGIMFFICVLISLLVLLSCALLAGGNIDYGLLLSNILGLLLLTASFIALGLYFSCLAGQPVVAAIGTLGFLLLFWIFDWVADSVQGWMAYLSLLKHFEQFNYGLIDSLSIVYFTLFIVTFLSLAIRHLDNERFQ